MWSNVPLFTMSGLHTGFFCGGGHTLVYPLGGLVACSPRNFFCIQRWTLTKFWGGGGGLKLDGENPSAPPPPPLCMQPCMYYTFQPACRLVQVCPDILSPQIYSRHHGKVNVFVPSCSVPLPFPFRSVFLSVPFRFRFKRNVTC